MCFIFKPTKPEVSGYVLSSTEVVEQIVAVGAHLMYPVALDSGGDYYATDEAGWLSIFDYLYKAYTWPKYRYPMFDCDDFALLMKGLVGAEFGLNTCGFAVGTALDSQGESFGHAFTSVITPEGLRLWEPQPGAWTRLRGVNTWPEPYYPQSILL